MFVQTQKTPNPNSLKFLIGKNISNVDSLEFSDKKNTDNELIRNILKVDGVKGVFLSEDFISVNKKNDYEWMGIYR